MEKTSIGTLMKVEKYLQEPSELQEIWDQWELQELWDPQELQELQKLQELWALLQIEKLFKDLKVEKYLQKLWAQEQWEPWKSFYEKLNESKKISVGIYRSYRNYGKWENFYQNLRKWSLSKQVLWWDLEKTEEVD